MAELLRHRQTKEAETDMFSLKPPRHISTLPDSGGIAGHSPTAASGHFRTHALQQLATNVRCIHVPIEERPQHRSLTTCSLHIRGSMSFLMYRLDVAYLFERRQVAGAVPNAFLKAREKAASEL